MGEHRPAPPTLQQRLYWPIAVACGAVMLAGTIGAAQAVAPQVVAAEHLALTPERSAEPSAHGGPLAPLSIGVVTSEPASDLELGGDGASGVGPIVRSSRPAERPVAVVSSVRVAGTSPAAETPSTVTTAPAITTPVETTTPPTTTATTTTPPATTTRTCRWCHHTSPATTTETATAATTTEATETTSETSDPLGDLLEDMFDQGGS